MNIARTPSGDIALIVEANTLSAELIEQATDLAIEVGSCKNLIVIVGVDELRSKPIFSDRWTGAGIDKQYVKLRLEIRRAIPTPDTPEPPRRRPARVARPRPKKIIAARIPRRRKVKA